MDINRARRNAAAAATATAALLIKMSSPQTPQQYHQHQLMMSTMLPPQQQRQFEHVVNDAIALAAAQLAACSCNLNYSAVSVEQDIKTKFWQCIPNLILIARLMTHANELCVQATQAAAVEAAEATAAAMKDVLYNSDGVIGNENDDGSTAADAIDEGGVVMVDASRPRRKRRMVMTLKADEYMLYTANVYAAINSVRAIWRDDCNARYDSTNHKDPASSSSYIRNTMGWHLVMFAMGRAEHSFGQMLCRACLEFERMAPACIQIDDGTGLSTAKLTFIADPSSRENVDKAITALNNVSVMYQQQPEYQHHLAEIGNAIKRIIIA